MREAVGNSFIFAIVIVFISIFILFFAGFTNYTKAFKVKNRIISILESRDNDVVSTGTGLDDKIVSDIENSLGTIGYTIDAKNTCNSDFNKRFKTKAFTTLTVSNNTYRYCVAKFNTRKGDYYAVIAYMYFELPLIGKRLEFPVYGETKIMGLLD